MCVGGGAVMIHVKASNPTVICPLTKISATGDSCSEDELRGEANNILWTLITWQTHLNATRWRKFNLRQAGGALSASL